MVNNRKTIPIIQQVYGYVLGVTFSLAAIKVYRINDELLGYLQFVLKFLQAQ